MKRKKHGPAPFSGAIRKEFQIRTHVNATLRDAVISAAKSLNLSVPEFVRRALDEKAQAVLAVKAQEVQHAKTD